MQIHPSALNTAHSTRTMCSPRRPWRLTGFFSRTISIYHRALHMPRRPSSKAHLLVVIYDCPLSNRIVAPAVQIRAPEPQSTGTLPSQTSCFLRQGEVRMHNAMFDREYRCLRVCADHLSHGCCFLLATYVWVDRCGILEDIRQGKKRGGWLLTGFPAR